jgi:hypothetical protein
LCSVATWEAATASDGEALSEPARRHRARRSPADPSDLGGVVIKGPLSSIDVEAAAGTPRPNARCADCVPDADLAERVTDVAFRLISAERTGIVDGETIAAELRPDVDNQMDVYYALREADRLGDLRCEAWCGGMGLPAMVRLP